ncbi:MAG: threonine-phosphate decarboxylase CobD [Acidobacteriota bacterium]
MTNYSDHNFTVHGGAIYQAARRWQVEREEILDFSANINPLGPPTSVIRVLTSEYASIMSYPDTTEFVTTLSMKLGIEPECLVVGNGSAALIFAAVRALKPVQALLLEPAFGEYRRALRSIGATIESIMLKEQDGFLPNFESLGEKLRSHQYDLVILNNPHNPSGAIYSPDKIKTLAGIAALNGTYLIIDEAFIEYAPTASVVPEIAAERNIVVLRSLTKFYAIPGLRIGYAICHREITERLCEQIESWPVSSIALGAARAAISDSSFEIATFNKNEFARTQFQTALIRMGIKVFPSAANFLLIKFVNRNGKALAKWLEQHHVLIRLCDSFTGLGDNFVRLAIRSQADNRRLLQLIEEWLKETDV